MRGIYMKSTTLVGTLLSGIVAPGGETTGFALKIGNVDCDTSGAKNASEFLNKPCVIAGEVREETYPTRGKVETMIARFIAADAQALPRAALAEHAFLGGTLGKVAARPGGEGPSGELTNVQAEVDVTSVPYQSFVGKVVAATGTFEAKNYPERKLVMIFKVSHLAAPGASTKT
jgi:hypothetical protein